MPFPNNSFDGIYCIEATCHAISRELVYAEILRVLKPGGFFGTYEWLITPKYNDQNPTHCEIRNRIEHSSGIPKLVDAENAIRALERVGWKVVSDEDLAITTPTNPVLWW
jgi:sterol 24-C-methyltransferase